MKILISSHAFAPAIGGLETVGEILARGFVDAGHEVKVLTQTPNPSGEENFPFEICRQPSAACLLNYLQWSEVYFQNNISLRTLWPLIVYPRPWVVTHHTWIRRLDGHLGWQDHLKRFLLQFGTNIVISHAVADELPVCAEIIGNPYRDDIFRELPTIDRNKELVFLGRLVSDKGIDLLLGALALLKREKVTPRLTIVGQGPEEASLRLLSEELGLEAQITFVGTQSGQPLVKLLNEHQVMVIPSLWAEPFGLVALEGIACGCVIIGSDTGGLPEAIGTCGVTFITGDARSLADVIRKTLTDDHLAQQSRLNAPHHLNNHSAKSVSAAYLRILAEAKG